MISDNIPIHNSKNDYEGMRKAGSLAAKILDELKKIINQEYQLKKLMIFVKK